MKKEKEYGITELQFRIMASLKEGQSTPIEISNYLVQNFKMIDMTPEIVVKEMKELVDKEFIAKSTNEKTFEDYYADYVEMCIEDNSEPLHPDSWFQATQYMFENQVGISDKGKEALESDRKTREPISDERKKELRELISIMRDKSNK